MSHRASTYKYLIPEFVWELRHFLAEGLVVEYLLESLVDDFKVDIVSDDSDMPHQMRLFGIFARIVAREAYDASELGDAVDWHALAARIEGAEGADGYTALIRESQERVSASEVPFKEAMLLKHADDALDNQAYITFVRNYLDPKLDSVATHKLRRRLGASERSCELCQTSSGAPRS